MANSILFGAAATVESATVVPIGENKPHTSSADNVSVEQTESNTRNHIAEVVLAQENAAESNHRRPYENYGYIWLQALARTTQLPDAQRKTGGETKAVGGVGRKETEMMTSALQYPQSFVKHPCVVAGSQSTH